MFTREVAREKISAAFCLFAFSLYFSIMNFLIISYYYKRPTVLWLVDQSLVLSHLFQAMYKTGLTILSFKGYFEIHSVNKSII